MPEIVPSIYGEKSTRLDPLFKKFQLNFCKQYFIHRIIENNFTFAVMKSPISLESLEKLTIFRYTIIEFIY